MGSCLTEFDYSGWAAWGAYRRAAAAAVRAGLTTQGSPLKRKRSDMAGAAGLDTFATWELTTEAARTYDRHVRRAVWRPLPASERREVARRKEQLYVRGAHNCWLHCDYPSECLHALCTAWAEGRIHHVGAAGDHDATGLQAHDGEHAPTKSNNDEDSADEASDSSLPSLGSSSESSNSSDGDYLDDSDGELD